jgi:hypothetical protein
MPSRSPVADHTLDIAAEPAAVIEAFFNPAALGVWWHAARAVTTPRMLGVYAIEWAPTGFRDEIFGPLGGVLYGTVVDYKPSRGFLVAEAHWLPPESEPVGPMAMHVECTVVAGVTKLRVLQTGGDDTPRWRRYYEITSQGWTGSLAALKIYLESAKTSDAAIAPHPSPLPAEGGARE